jgi:hypothetical protein
MTWILPRQLHTSACALDTAALSLDCTEQSQICAQSLFVRSKPSPSAIWLRKWKRDSWTRHLSGRILRPSLGKRFATEWTSSLEATHASHSVQPGSAEAKTTQGTCGPTSQTAFDFSDPGAASLRTSKDISAWGCPTSSKTWQEWVTERRGAYSARLNAARPTSGSVCSSWPTATTRDWKDTGDMSQSMTRKDGKARMDTLGRVVQVNYNTDGNRPESWGTPTARDHKSGRGKEERDYKELTPMVERTQSGKLNPRWVETLMGLPVGWTMPSCASPVTIERTNSDCSGMELCRQQRNEPSEPCSEK